WRREQKRYRGTDHQQASSFWRFGNLRNRQLSRQTFLQSVLTSEIHRKTGNLVGRSLEVCPIYHSRGLGKETQAPFLMTIRYWIGELEMGDSWIKTFSILHNIYYSTRNAFLEACVKFSVESELDDII